MKNFWNDGSSALSNYYPTMNDRKREQSITIEYVQLPVYTDTTITKRKPQYRIKTKNLHILTLSAFLSLRWTHSAVMAIMGILCCTQWIAAFASSDINIIAESVFVCGITSGIITTIMLILYRYNISLQQQYERIESLRKRRNITNAAQRALILWLISCIPIYGIVIPGMAKILLQII